MSLRAYLREQQRAADDFDGLFSGYVVMRSYYPGDRYPGDDLSVAPPHLEPETDPVLAQSHSRYCDRPMDWRTRLSGLAGATIVYATILAVALFTWKTVYPPVAVTSQPLTVVDLAPLKAPPEPVKDVAPGPEQVEKQEARPEPEPDVVVPPPIIQLAKPDQMTRKITDPVEVVDPGPPVPETTAPKSIAAPSANRMSNNTRPNWEGEVLAHLERFRRYPARARAAREEGVSYVRFTMNRTGMVLASAIVRRSGSTTLDQAALDTLKRAQPLPAIPPDRPDMIELTIPVEFFLSAGR